MLSHEPFYTMCIPSNIIKNIRLCGLNMVINDCLCYTAGFVHYHLCCMYNDELAGWQNNTISTVSLV